jgi:hypothetical protein
MQTLPNVGDKNQFSDQGEKKNLRPKIGYRNIHDIIYN